MTFRFKDLKHDKGSIFLEKLSNIGWNKLYRKSFLTKNRLAFNEKLLRYEDLEFVPRCYLLAGEIAFIPRSLVVYRTEISTSNQANLSNYPTAIFDALISLKKFLLDKHLYTKYQKDLKDLAVYHILAILLVTSPAGQRSMLKHAPPFFRKFDLDRDYISKLDENKQDLLKAIGADDHDAYLAAERKYLIDSREIIISRIPPLEERIEVELAELYHYRDNPSFKTIGILFRKALTKKMNRLTSKFIK